MIVPEIDVPSHALPLLAPHPELQLPGTTGKLDLSNPASYTLVQDLLEEFLPQFPAPYWHTGGDEYLGNWEYANYPQLQTYAQQHYGPNANGQDVYIGFVNWVDGIVHQYGKTLRAWNDLYGVTGNVNTPNSDIIMEMWYPYNTPQDALSKGHTIMNCNYLTLYYVLGGVGLTNDPANTINLYENWAPHLQFPDLTYQWPGSINLDPLTPGLRGGKFHIWCDYPDKQTQAQVQAGIVNHLRGLAQNSWGSPKLVPTYQAFLQVIDPVGHTPDYGPDFTLTTAAPSLTVQAGQTATYSLKLTPLMGLTEAISLNCNSRHPPSRVQHYSRKPHTEWLARYTLHDHRVDHHHSSSGCHEFSHRAAADDPFGICLPRSCRRRACSEEQESWSRVPSARLGDGIIDAPRPGAGRELRIVGRDLHLTAADTRGEL